MSFSVEGMVPSLTITWIVNGDSDVIIRDDDFADLTDVAVVAGLRPPFNCAPGLQ